MAKKSRKVLKTYFQTGDQPTESEFVNWFDSSLILSGSNGITGSLIISGSPNDNADGSKVMLYVMGDITSSGNISASGTIYANNFQSTGEDVAGITFADDMNLTGDITASGDISASGNILASNAHLRGANAELTFSDNNDKIYFDGTDIIHQIDNNDILKVQAKGIFVSSSITASNNISASGNILGNSILSNGHNIGFANQGSQINLGFENNTPISIGKSNNPTFFHGNITASGDISASLVTGKHIFGGSSTFSEITASGHISGGLGKYVRAGTGSFGRIEGLSPISVGDHIIFLSSSEFSGAISASGGLSASGDVSADKLYISGDITGSNRLLVQRSNGQGNLDDTTSNVATFQNNDAATNASIGIVAADTGLSQIHFATSASHYTSNIEGSIRYHHNNHASIPNMFRFWAGDICNAVIGKNSSGKGVLGLGTDAAYAVKGGPAHDHLVIQGLLGGFGLQISSSTGAGYTVDRGANTNNIQWILKTAGVTKWILGNLGEGNDDFSFYKDGSATGEVLTLQHSTGRVGIGTTTPSYPLDVVGDIRATGDIIAQRYIVSSSVTHLTQSFSSGSTIFGDTQNDIHQFTGSLSITGSITASGNISSSGIGSFRQLIVDEGHVNGGIEISTNSVGSYIKDTGNGFLFIQASDSLVLESAVGENYFKGNKDGSVQLYYDNLEKFATTNTGINVTGDITASVVSSSDHILTHHITASGNISASGAGPHYLGGQLRLFSATTGDRAIRFGNEGDNNQVIQSSPNYMYIDADDQLIVRADNQFIVSSSRTGIGAFDVNITPPSVLHVSGTAATDTTFKVEGSDGTDYLTVGVGGHVTASGDISSSLASTGSFGRVEATKLVVPTGGAAAPSITFEGDLDTGIYRSGNDVLSLQAGGGNVEMSISGPSSTILTTAHLSVGSSILERHITASGNISSSGHIIAEHISSSGDFILATSSTPSNNTRLKNYDTYLGLFTETGGPKTLKASSLVLSSTFGDDAPTNGIYAKGNISASNLIVQNDITGSNRLLIQKSTGEGSPAAGTSDVAIFQNNTSGQDASIAIIAADDKKSQLHFGRHDDIDVGGIRYFHDDHTAHPETMQFRVNNSQMMTLKSNNLGIGSDSTKPQDFIDIKGALSGGGLTVSSSNGSRILNKGAHTWVTIDRSLNSKHGFIEYATTGTTKWTLGNIAESNDNFYIYSGNTAGDKHISLTSDSTVFHTNITSSNISSSGAIYSTNHEAIWQGSVFVDADNASNWFGPNKNGLYNNLWNVDYGNNTDVVLLEEEYAVAGIIVPYKCKLVGFRAIASSITSGHTVELALYYEPYNSVTFNNTSGNASDATIASVAAATSGAPGAAENPMHWSKLDATQIMEANSMLYPRIKCAGTSGANVTFTVLVQRIK